MAPAIPSWFWRTLALIHGTSFNKAVPFTRASPSELGQFWVAVLFLWIPLRQRPGLGTLLNVLVIGNVMNLILAHVAPPTGLVARIVVLFLGVALNGVVTGCYIGAGLGPGPRDGLMVGLAARGLSLRLVRTTVEMTVLVAGWVNVGWGTLLYALSIGPLAQIFIPRFTLPPRKNTEAS